MRQVPNDQKLMDSVFVVGGPQHSFLLSPETCRIPVSSVFGPKNLLHGFFSAPILAGELFPSSKMNVCGSEVILGVPGR